jgi:hypothetical protein
MNLYGYCNNDSVSNIDTDGTWSWTAKKGLIIGPDKHPWLQFTGKESGLGLKVGLSAVGNVFSLGWWKGGKAKYDSDFKGAKIFADIGLVSGAAAVVGIAAEVGGTWVYCQVSARLATIGAGSSAIATALRITQKLLTRPLTLSKSVACKIDERPYLNSKYITDMIMQSGIARPDPRKFANCWRWDVPGSYNGSNGIWELVINAKTNEIMHFQFNGH